MQEAVKVELITVGSEITRGHIPDTNSQWLARYLTNYGFYVHYITSVSDDINKIGVATRDALARSEAVIITGGLGPTQDDLTREAVSESLGVKLVYDTEIEKWLKSIFQRSKFKIPESNLRQAYVLEGATVISQKIGTAPGMKLMVGKKPLYLLPGVPAEMKEMVNRFVIKDLLEIFQKDVCYLEKTISLWGITESRLADLLSGFIKDITPKGYELAYQASFSQGIKVRLTGLASDKRKETEFENVYKDLHSMLSSWIFSTSDKTLEEELVTTLMERSITIAVVESLTGGLISERIVSVPNASKVFKGSLVAYSLEAKNKLLNLNLSNAVSPHAAIALAEATKALFGSDFAVSTTGVAGPDPLEGYEPGKVFIGIVGQKSFSHEYDFIGDRTRVRHFASSEALNVLRKYVIELIH